MRAPYRASVAHTSPCVGSAIDPRARLADAGAMVTAFLLSVRQLGDRAILAVLAKSLGVTLAIFVALGVGLYVALDAAMTWASGQRDGVGIVAIATLVIGVGVAWLTFRIVAIAVIGLFADEVVAAVEAKYYPDALARAHPIGVAASLRMGAGSAARAILVNLVMLPVYLVLIVTGIGTPIAFFLVNGWLLGRDFGDMAAARHVPAAALRPLATANRGARMLLGLAVTALLVVPLVNLVAPIIGAAMATHLFHRGKA